MFILMNADLIQHTIFQYYRFNNRLNIFQNEDQKDNGLVIVFLLNIWVKQLLNSLQVIDNH
jgi:hypothetical protein